MSRRVAIAVALAAIALPAAVARAAPLSACTSARGTIVAVDFAHWGGPVVRGCGTGASSGFALLHDAGFTSAGDQHDGPAFICRLGNSAFRGGTEYPTPSEDACIQTPPTSAYWSYWTAKPGRNAWSYSSAGAMSDVPTAGEVEVWTFGAASAGGSGRPTVSPASLRPRQTTVVATTTVHTTHTTAAAAPTATHTTETSATSSTSSHTAAPKRKATKAHPQRHTTHAATTDAATTAAPNAGAVPVVAAKPTKVKASAGSPASLIVGIGLAAVLCGGAGWAAWRRRRLS